MSITKQLQDKLKQIASKDKPRQKELEEIYKELKPLEEDYELEVILEPSKVTLSASFGYFHLYPKGEEYMLDFYVPWKPRRQYQASTEEDPVDHTLYHIARKLHEQEKQN